MIKTGWLSPSGKFYPCREGDQFDKAKEIVYDVYHEYYILDPESLLLHKGWIEITENSNGELIVVSKKVSILQTKYLLKGVYKNFGGFLG